MKFVITLIILFFLFRYVLPILLRWALKAFVKKTIRNGTFMNANGPFTQAPPPAEPEGHVKVEGPARPEKPKDYPGGEYVDYEEVK